VVSPFWAYPNRGKAEKQKGGERSPPAATIKSPTLDEILDAHSIKDLIKPTPKNV